MRATKPRTSRNTSLHKEKNSTKLFTFVANAILDSLKILVVLLKSIIITVAMLASMWVVQAIATGMFPNVEIIATATRELSHFATFVLFAGFLFKDFVDTFFKG